MKIRQLLLLPALLFASCTMLEQYTIDAPEDLQDKIAEYEAEQEAQKVLPDGAVEFELSPVTVGLEDHSQAWWTEFGQYFTIPTGKKLYLQFVNYAGESNWNNWDVVVTTPYERATDGYSEYFVLRADGWKWGIGDTGSGNGVEITINDVAPAGDDDWASFRAAMAGATVEMTIDHADAGMAYVSATATATDGTVIKETYSQEVSSRNDINAFLTADGCHLVMKLAYITASDYPVVADAEPAKLTLTGYPTSLAYGEEDFWGETKASVTFDDESSIDVPAGDLNIIAPDLTTPGTKSVLVTYSLTKKGNITSKAVASYYNFELVADIESLSIVKEPSHNTYYYYGEQALPFRPYGMELEAVFQGGVKIPLSLADVTVSEIALTEGEQEVTFSYTSGSKTVTAKTTVNIVKGGMALGVPSKDSEWWKYFSPRLKVPTDGSVSYEMDVYSVAGDNWHGPVAILNTEAAVEYAVLRMDNFGWGASYDASSNAGDWNWVLFKPMLDNAHVKITATGNGTTVVLRYDVLWANGDVHYQQYTITPETPDDVYFSITVDHCYAVFVPGDYGVEPDPGQDPGEDPGEDPQPGEKTLTSISATATAYLIGGADVVSLCEDQVIVTGHYSDNTSERLTTGYSVEYPATVAGTPGVYNDLITVTHGTLTAKAELTIAASSHETQTTPVGAEDFSNGWWSTFSRDWTVAAGESQSVSMSVKSQATANHQGPVVLLRKADLSEFAALRMDNYGWLYAQNTFANNDVLGWVLAGNWNWDNFLSGLADCKVTVTVANSGLGKASVIYHVVYANSEEHFQSFKNITVDSNDLQFGFVTEASYLVFD